MTTGVAGTTRTSDTQFRKLVLCPLSYGDRLSPPRRDDC